MCVCVCVSLLQGLGDSNATATGKIRKRRMPTVWEPLWPVVSGRAAAGSWSHTEVRDPEMWWKVGVADSGTLERHQEVALDAIK